MRAEGVIEAVMFWNERNNKSHRDFYNGQRFTRNVTRAHRVANGYSPNVRPFEAAACGAPVITDEWPGLEEFFQPGAETLVARSAGDVLACLRDLDALRRPAIAERARKGMLGAHTALHRAIEIEALVSEIRTSRAGEGRIGVPRADSVARAGSALERARVETEASP